MADKIDIAPKMAGVSLTPEEWNSSSSVDGDMEKQIQQGTTVQLKRRLQSRHLQMIAIGMSHVLNVLS